MSKIISLIVLVIILGAGAFYIKSRFMGSSGYETQKEETATSSENGAGGSVATSTAITATTTFTMSDVAQHKDQTSCYTIIRSNVYDLTAWINKHPGGEGAILSICGKDGTQAFVNKHGGKQRQETLLETFKIGVLTQ